MILPSQVKVVRVMVKDNLSNKAIKDYIDRCASFNSRFCSKKGKVRKWTVTIQEE